MAEKQRGARRRSLPDRNGAPDTDRDTAENGRQGDIAKYEKELAGYLQDRIKPGLNRGSIPLLARSIAKEIARHEYANGSADQDVSDEADAELTDEELTDDADDERTDDADDEPRDDADDDDEPTADADDEPSDESDGDLDLETALHEIQAELGEEWILYFSVQGDDTWLTAEKDDASQRVEAPSASVLTEAVKVLNEGGGRSGSKRREPR